MELRPAEVADAAAIARVHVDVWRATYAAMLAPADLALMVDRDRTDEWRARLARQAGDRGTIVATRAGAVVGFVSYGPARTARAACTGELFALYVLPSAQGLGAGAALFRACAGALAAAGHRGMLLWVLRDNPSRGFYRRMGGVELGEQTLPIGAHAYAEVAYGWADAAAVSSAASASPAT